MDAAAASKGLLQDEIERVPESGVAASCCAVVLSIFSVITIVLFFPFSLIYVIKVHRTRTSYDVGQSYMQ